MSTPIESNTVDLRTIVQKVNGVQENIVESFTAIGEMGGTVPSSKVSSNLVTAITSIPKGTDMNFDVVAYNTLDQLLASRPKENTIGVVTTTTVTGWIFSVEEPTNMANGAIWFPTSTESVGQFNALKGSNGIMVYPMFAKQWIGSNIVDLTVRSYINGQWVAWWNGELYISGNQYDFITGGWWNNTSLAYTASTKYPNSGLDLSGYIGGEYITVYAKGGYSTNATTRKMIDLSPFSKLTFQIASDSDRYEYAVVIHDVSAGDFKGNMIAYSVSGEIKLSSITGNHYISLLSVNNRTVKIGNIRLVK